MGSCPDTDIDPEGLGVNCLPFYDPSGSCLLI